MSERRPFHENRCTHFTTKRLDRRTVGKWHPPSLCGLADQDYNTPGIYGPEPVYRDQAYGAPAARRDRSMS